MADSDDSPGEVTGDLMSGPFGNPDGSRANIGEISRNFIDFQGSLGTALATRDDDLSARVVVGKMGAGKTVYLRRFHDYANRSDDLYAAEIEEDPPSTETILTLLDWFTDDTRTETWATIWRRAIMRAVASHLLREPDNRQKLESKQIDPLEDEYGELLLRLKTPLRIYDCVDEILNTFDTEYKLRRYLNDSRWAEIENIVLQGLKAVRPMCFYLDALDDNFPRAPKPWMECQSGLFHAVMDLVRSKRFGSRLHIVISIRDIVLSDVLASEQAGRFRGVPHIRTLDWDYNSALFLFEGKIRLLANSDYAGAEGRRSRDIPGWIGLKQVHNRVRGIDEEIQDYLIRHTRLLPRDIVDMGNRMARLLRARKDKASAGLDAANVTRIVERASANYGRQQLDVCSNQLVAQTMPSDAARHGYSDLYIGKVGAFARFINDELRKFLQTLGYDHFSYSDLVTAENLHHERFGENSNVLTVLWHSGLLGYECNQPGAKCAHFYSISDADEFELAREKETYVLHPCLIDTIPHLEAIDDVVRPCHHG